MTAAEYAEGEMKQFLEDWKLLQQVKRGDAA